MAYRQPDEITHKGVKLSEALAAHRRWLRGEADGERLEWARADMAGANMSHANMAHADMAGANIARANMDGTIGNMREIKSAQFDKWALTWITAPDGVVTLQIGCQRHTLDLWEKSDPHWIDALDQEATEWWSRYRDVVLALVKASPAVPYGEASA